MIPILWPKIVLPSDGFGVGSPLHVRMDLQAIHGNILRLAIFVAARFSCAFLRKVGPSRRPDFRRLITSASACCLKHENTACTISLCAWGDGEYGVNNGRDIGQTGAVAHVEAYNTPGILRREWKPLWQQPLSKRRATCPSWGAQVLVSDTLSVQTARRAETSTSEIGVPLGTHWRIDFGRRTHENNTVFVRH